MIDPSLFTVESLLAAPLDDMHGGRDMWRKHARIVRDYMPPFPRPGTRPICVVQFEGSFLRYSNGPRQGHFWDCYGDDYFRPEIALIALLQAPIPPFLIHRDLWRKQAEAAAPAAGKETR